MRHWLWFIASGTAAALLGVIAIYVVHAPLWVIFVLLPTAVTSFDPSSLSLTQEILKSLFVYGGAFLLYGTAGWQVGNAVQYFVAWRRRRSRQL